MGKIILTDDEIVAYLKKSNLSNILVEGPDDLMIYNWIEHEIDNLGVAIFPCGGRSMLFKVFERRDEFAHKKVTFIADKDLYVFNGIPAEVQEIIFTSGYSIENDLYAFGKDVIFNLFTQDEASKFNQAIESLIVWYSSEIFKYLNGQNHHISCHLNQVIPENTTYVNDAYLNEINNIEELHSLIEEVKKNEFLKLRGKFIFDCIVRYLSHKKRRSKYSKDNIMELCLKLVKNAHFDRIIKEVRYKLLD